ncbi:hypothetical protein [Allorhodopirellula heiligendammensis]|uniref:Uncharacterized protein n=1 Tax=Allorhodopirellula heiligendammensis TaxID=2714739 RepID=A0A5C6BW34_9BACT|nr:hypothetical protein [Allorhodopirellula heiligendammensis]TWU16500.1 hypothetical protein Poly21_37050 [Allorhodopirellula heiligendammensis]
MSAPEPDFDQLLSDHLDGQLDETDTQMLQQSMQEIPALQSQFDAMRADREDLRALFAAQHSTGPHLKRDFAARVLAESRRRRLAMEGDQTADNNGETHTSLTCEQPIDARNRRRVSLILGLVATAAAVLLITSLNSPDELDAPVIAQHEPSATSEPQPAADPERPLVDIETAQINGPTEPIAPQPEPMIASADAPKAAVGELPSEPNRIDEPSRPSPNAIVSLPTPSEAMDRSPTVSVGDDASLLVDSPFTGAMMVYEVRLSPQGRQMDVLSDAMRQAGLQDAPRLPINRDVIAAAKRADTFDEEAKFQVIFLQASAKKVDRLFLSLQQEPRLVEAVGLSLITDAPMLQMVGKLTRVDATKIQHDEPLSFELESNDSEELAAFRELLGEQTFLPLEAIPSSKDLQQPESSSSAGDDVITRALILVR